MTIVLIGFASCGKSTIGDAVGRISGMKHIDLDRVIEDLYEQKYGRQESCREVFKILGDDGFTKLENDALRSLSNEINIVLSTGGRAPMYEGNQAILKSLGRVVYLKCDIDTILARMKHKGCPLSMGGSAEGVRAQWKVRDPVYFGLADVVVDNGDGAMAAEEIAWRIWGGIT